MGSCGVPPWTVERGRRNEVVGCFPWPIGVLGCLRWLGGRSVRWAASVATGREAVGAEELATDGWRREMRGKGE